MHSTPEDLELGTTNERECVVFVSRGLDFLQQDCGVEMKHKEGNPLDASDIKWKREGPLAGRENTEEERRKGIENVT